MPTFKEVAFAGYCYLESLLDYNTIYGAGLRLYTVMRSEMHQAL